MDANNQLHRTNFRCHLLCIEPHKCRHQKFTRWAGRYMQREFIS